MKSHARVTAQPLPYAYDALQPHGITEDQLRDHYLKHHCGYATALEALVARESNLCSIVDGQDFAARKMTVARKRQHRSKKSSSSAELNEEETMLVVARAHQPLTPAEALMLRTSKGSQVSNLASMVVNHDFFWKCMRGNGDGNGVGDDTDPAALEAVSTTAVVGANDTLTNSTASSAVSATSQSTIGTAISVGPETTSFSLRLKDPSLAMLLSRVEKDFGSVRNLMKTFEAAALQLFGSGWVWLAWSRERQRLVVMTTRDSVNPLTIDTSPHENTNNSMTTHSAAVRSATFVPVIGIDMWEHAYLSHGSSSSGTKNNNFMSADLNHEKRRYLNKFWAAANWSFAAENFRELTMSKGVNGPTTSTTSVHTAVTVKDDAQQITPKL